MPKRKRHVYCCPACGGVCDSFYLTALGGKVRPYFRDRDGNALPGVVITEILCWWCREKHSPDEVEKCMVLPRKSALANGSQSSTSRSLVAGPLSEYSELWAFLTSRMHPDGESRTTGCLSLSCDVDLLKMSLQDEETGQYACLTGTDLTTLLTEIELRLGDGSLAWRPSRYKRSRK